MSDNVALVTALTPSDAIQPPIASVTSIAPMTPVIANTNAAGVLHFSLPAPIRRWNGTAWEALYIPRM
jgi:hypothetical protein